MTLAARTTSVIVVAIGLVLVVAGCGDESSSSDEVDAATTSSELGDATTIVSSVRPTPTAATTTPTSVTSVATTKAPTTVPAATINVSSVAEFPIGATATYDDNSTVVVVAYTQPYSDPTSILGPPAGVEFAVATVQICAGDTATKFIDAGSWEVVGGAGETFKQSLRATPFATGLTLLPIEANVCVDGDVGFEVPAGQAPVFVLWNDPDWESAKWRIG